MDRGLGPSSYPPSARIRDSAAFKRLLQQRGGIRAAHFAIKWCDNGGIGARLGCIVAKRLTPLAVHRNRVKRMAREAFRVRREPLGNIDILFRQTVKVGDPYDPVVLHEIETLFQRLMDAQHTD